MKIISRSIYVILFLLIGCTPNKINSNDYNLAIETSLNYILSNMDLPIEYKNQPLQVIPAKDLWIKELIVNGNKCIILPSSTSSYKMRIGMDIFKPIPIAEIVQIKNADGFLTVDIIFRSTGHAFLLKLKK